MTRNLPRRTPQVVWRWISIGGAIVILGALGLLIYRWQTWDWSDSAHSLVNGIRYNDPYRLYQASLLQEREGLGLTPEKCGCLLKAIRERFPEAARISRYEINRSDLSAGFKLHVEVSRPGQKPFFVYALTDPLGQFDPYLSVTDCLFRYSLFLARRRQELDPETSFKTTQEIFRSCGVTRVYFMEHVASIDDEWFRRDWIAALSRN